MCSKVAHPTQRAAEIALRRFDAQCVRRGSYRPVAVYLCPECRSWHLTSKPLSRSWAARVAPPARP